MTLPTKEHQLEALLLELFTNDELERFLVLGPGGDALLPLLPDPRESRAIFMFRSREALRRCGMLTDALFARLKVERASKAEAIDRVRDMFLAATPVAQPDSNAARPRVRQAFVAYALEDEQHLGSLVKCLTSLSRQGYIDVLHGHDVPVGEDRVADVRIESAELILLLVSADFLASTYCWEVVTPRAMALHDAGRTRVVPIHLRPCDLAGAPFCRLQGVPGAERPITNWPAPDAAWTAVARAIRAIVAPVRPA